MVTPLPARDICPECQADRNVVRELLEDDKGSDNWEIGRFMLKQCRACREAITGEVKDFASPERRVSYDSRRNY